MHSSPKFWRKYAALLLQFSVLVPWFSSGHFYFFYQFYNFSFLVTTISLLQAQVPFRTSANLAYLRQMRVNVTRWLFMPPCFRVLAVSPCWACACARDTAIHYFTVKFTSSNSIIRHFISSLNSCIIEPCRTIRIFRRACSKNSRPKFLIQKAFKIPLSFISLL